MTSRNAGSVRTRTVGSALYNMSVQMSNIISSQVSVFPLFLPDYLCAIFLHRLLSSYLSIHIPSPNSNSLMFASLQLWPSSFLAASSS